MRSVFSGVRLFVSFLVNYVPRSCSVSVAGHLEQHHRFPELWDSVREILQGWALLRSVLGQQGRQEDLYWLRVLGSDCTPSRNGFLSKIVGSLSTRQLPVCILGATPSLIRVLEDNRADGRQSVVYQCFDEETLLLCVLQADQDVFGLVSVITLVEYLE